MILESFRKKHSLTIFKTHNTFTEAVFFQVFFIRLKLEDSKSPQQKVLQATIVHVVMQVNTIQFW